MKKMKNLKYMALSGVVLLLSALSFTACTDGNDWDVDKSYDRLFSVQNLSVSATETEVTVTWTGTSDTEYYIIELSQESLYDTIPLNGTETSMIYGEDKSITRSPYTITGLDAATEYFIRIKGMSDVKEESRWFYLEDVFFKTKSEQIIESVVPSINTAVVNWTPGLTVDVLAVLKNNEVVQRITLSATAIQEGTYTLEDLESNSSYTVVIYNGEAIRGQMIFTTVRDIPEASLTLFLNAGDVLDQNYLDREIDPALHSTVTIVFEENAEFYNASSITLPGSVSFTFYGMPGEKKPIIGINLITFGSQHDFISFQNLNITGIGIKEDGSTFSMNYLFNQGNNPTQVGTLEFIDCYFHDFVNSLIRLQGTPIKIIENLKVENSIIKGGTTAQYSLIHVDANSGSGKIENISFNESTI
ncbi:MAG: fibronectin type III domain-containing protein, partial [Bacteroides sp.]|nr:fibronectin type III domain-containing protein [Bacteroides sp.]